MSGYEALAVTIATLIAAGDAAVAQKDIIGKEQDWMVAVVEARQLTSPVTSIPVTDIRVDGQPTTHLVITGVAAHELTAVVGETRTTLGKAGRARLLPASISDAGSPLLIAAAQLLDGSAIPVPVLTTAQLVPLLAVLGSAKHRDAVSEVFHWAAHGLVAEKTAKLRRVGALYGLDNDDLLGEGRRLVSLLRPAWPAARCNFSGHVTTRLKHMPRMIAMAAGVSEERMRSLLEALEHGGPEERKAARAELERFRAHLDAPARVGSEATVGDRLPAAETEPQPEDHGRLGLECSLRLLRAAHRGVTDPVLNVRATNEMKVLVEAAISCGPQLGGRVDLLAALEGSVRAVSAALVAAELGEPLPAFAREYQAVIAAALAA